MLSHVRQIGLMLLTWAKHALETSKQGAISNEDEMKHELVGVEASNKINFLFEIAANEDIINPL